jgi:hypothetical protein
MYSQKASIALSTNKLQSWEGLLNGTLYTLLPKVWENPIFIYKLLFLLVWGLFLGVLTITPTSWHSQPEGQVNTSYSSAQRNHTTRESHRRKGRNIWRILESEGPNYRQVTASICLLNSTFYLWKFITF